MQCKRSQFDSWVGKIRWRRDRLLTQVFFGFACGSSGKESTHNEETWVRSPGSEDPLEKGKQLTPVLWPREFHGLIKSQTRLSDFHFTSLHLCSSMCKVADFKFFILSKIFSNLIWLYWSYLYSLLFCLGFVEHFESVLDEYNQI